MWVRAANGALIGSWAVWAAPLVPWLIRGFGFDDGVTQGLVAVLTAALVARGVDLRAVWDRLGSPPHLQPWAAALAVGGPVVGLIEGHVHQTVHALCVIAAGYGIVGLYASRARWRDLRPVAGLAVGVLPILVIVDVILGWPLRKAIAWFAAGLLGGISVETVIQVEGGFAHIDVPCAGFRGLWAFTALFLLLTLARGRTVDRRWFGAALAGSAVLVVANVLRVVVVVGTGHVLGWSMLAESVHQPLGLVGFLAALAVATAVPAGSTSPIPALPRAAPWMGLAVGLALALAIARPIPDRTVDPPAPIAVPAGWEEIAPSSAELGFAAQYGATVTKARLPEPGASIVFVESRSWLAHHVPEHCLRASGWTVSDDRPAWVEGRPVRIVTVTRDGVEATALWWFQAGAETTDDLVVRIREGWTTGEPWVLVSVLVPGVQQTNGPVLASLIPLIRNHVEGT